MGGEGLNDLKNVLIGYETFFRRHAYDWENY